MTPQSSSSAEVARVSEQCELVILNQYYFPDVASTGHLLHELATEVASRGRAVSVATSFPCYGPRSTWQACAGHEMSEGVAVHRMRTTRLGKDRLLGRLLDSVTFLMPLFVRQLLRRSEGRVFMYTTNPPFLGIIGGIVSWMRRHDYVVLLHDSYPQLAVWVGKIRPSGPVERVWHLVNRVMYRRARETIVLCDRAKDLVCSAYGVDPDHVHVIHNWADPKQLLPLPKEETEFAKQHGLDSRFTLLYSGNLGLYYEFASLLELAERFKIDDDFRLVFVGAGGKRDWIAAEVMRRGLSNVIMLPYQPFSSLNDSLNACDVSLVSIAKGIEGISFPSKLYSSLAVGKAVIAISEIGSELQRMVEGTGSGIWVPLGDLEALEAAVRYLRSNRAERAAMGVRARAAMLQEFTIEAATTSYLEVIDRASRRHRR